MHALLKRSGEHLMSNIGDIRAQLLQGTQFNRDEIPHLTAAATAYDETRSATLAGHDALMAARKANAHAATEVTSAAGGAAEVERLLNELKVAIGSAVVNLTDARGHTNNVKDSVDTAANAIDNTLERAKVHQGEMEAARDLSYRATELYIRTWDSEDRDPVPKASQHTADLSILSDTAATRSHESDHARTDIGAMRPTPDRLSATHEQRLTEAEHIKDEIDRLAIRAGAFFLSLSGLREEHGELQTGINHIAEILRWLGGDPVGTAVKLMPQEAEAVAKQAEEIANRQ
jgi:hypothetical protein